MPGRIVSSHRQRVVQPGRLRVVARAGDGTVEAIDDPARRFYLGVQWHPERGEATDCPRLNGGVIRALIENAAQASSVAG
jgi:putative glutamine amidotransferase